MRFSFLATVLTDVLRSAAHAQSSDHNDAYLWLEDAHGERAMAWVNAENAETLNVLEKDARYPSLYANALKIAEAAAERLSGVVWRGRRLGAKFDVRNFHDLVLKSGPMPMSVLQASAAQWTG